MRRSAAATQIGAQRVRSNVSGNRWQAPFRRVVVTHNGPLSADEVAVAALLSSPAGAALGGWSALAFDGLEDRISHPPCVILPAGARRPKLDGVDFRFSGSLGPEDVDPDSSPRRTRPARSLVDVASLSKTPDGARVVILRGLQARLATPATLTEMLEHRGQCHHLALMRETVLDAEGGVMSVPELEFARLLRRHELPEPTRQKVCRRPGGRYYLDAAWSELRFSVEIEGAHHLIPEQRDHDWDRHNDLTVDGWRMLHISSFQVRHRESKVAALLKRYFAQHAGSPT